MGIEANHPRDPIWLGRTGERCRMDRVGLRVVITDLDGCGDDVCPKAIPRSTPPDQESDDHKYSRYAVETYDHSAPHHFGGTVMVVEIFNLGTYLERERSRQ
jgi:hypothetical protein